MWNAARLPWLVLATAALLAACSDNTVPSAVSRVAASKADLERGKYLTKAADCVACHTSAEGAPFAGGYALQSPYGPIYGTNITPDKQTGIGSYTADDLFRVLHDGKTPSGKHLYAAMPYTSYRLLTRGRLGRDLRLPDVAAAGAAGKHTDRSEVALQLALDTGLLERALS